MSGRTGRAWMIDREEGLARTLASAALTLVFGMLGAAGASAATLVDQDDFKLSFGMRMQARMEFSRVMSPTSGMKWQRDFMVRRTRLSAAGEMQGAAYKFEWKIDGSDQVGASPRGAVENAYVQLPVYRDAIQVRAGLHDAPFSRDLLTSDSKQLAVDRGVVSGVPSGLGMADNVVGFDLLGMTPDGRAQYAVGLYDNRYIDGNFQDWPMVAGRFDYNFGSTKDVFQDAHFGDDSWCSIGVDGSFQSGIEDSSGADEGRNTAVGIDGMIDVPTQAGRVLLRGEVNSVGTRPTTGGTTVNTTVWMAGAGLLILDQRVQPVVRFDQVRRDDAVGGGTTNVTYVGINYYRKGHALKVQSDVKFESGTHEALDGFRLQAQLYF